MKVRKLRFIVQAPSGDSAIDQLEVTGLNMDRVFNTRSDRMNATHLLCSIAKLPNLELKLGNFNFEFERFQIQIQFKKTKKSEKGMKLKSFNIEMDTLFDIIHYHCLLIML
jgi:hypothetical protein